MSASPLPLRYAAGQLWRAEGRTPEEQPLLLINKVERHPQGGDIFHITLDELRIQHPGLADGLMTRLAHAPVTQQTLERSNLQFVELRVPDPAFQEGYAQWKQAFDAGQAGAYDISVMAIAEVVERQLNGRRVQLG